MPKYFAFAVLLGAVVVLALTGTRASAQAPGFAVVIDNPYFPLTSGTVLQYDGTRDGKKAASTTVVTHETTSSRA
jgi:hypothetical protein